MAAVLKFLLHTVHNNIWRTPPQFILIHRKKSVWILKLVTKIVRIKFLINHHILEFQVFSFGVN